MPEIRGTGEQLEALLRAATNHVIIRTDPSGLITMFNSGAERLLGYRAEEIVGVQTPDLFFRPGELAATAAELGVAPHYAAVVAAGLPDPVSHWTRDWRWLTSAGRPVIVRLSVSAIRRDVGTTQGEPPADPDVAGSEVADPDVAGGEVAGSVDGTAEAFLAIASDVTSELEASDELRIAERRWRMLLGVLPDTTVLVLDEFLRYQSVLGAAAAGPNEPSAILGKTIYDAVVLADAAQLEEFARGALRGEQRTEELALSSGTHLIVAMPTSSHRGRPEVMIFAQNVTAERERERSVRTAQERFRRLFDEAPNGTALVSLDTDFLQVNPMMCRLLGRPAESLMGQPVTSIAADDDDESEITRYFGDLLTSGDGHANQDWAVRRGDDAVIYLSASGSVLLDEAGEPESILINLVDISQRHRMEQRLAHLADHDPLTGLANRRRFDQELSAHLDRSRRYGASGALMVLDLDHFKQVNDTLGHAAGDQLIVATAEALRRRLRTSDVIARMGGDEFAILLPNVDRAAAESVASSVVSLVRDEVRIFAEAAALGVTTSVGIVLIDKTDMTTTELLAAADLTMYEAKESGRDRFAISDSAGRRPTPVATVPSWADRIAAALREQHLLLYAQPILNVNTDRYESAELLVRLLYEDSELILPERFLYIAERAGMMPSIDLWVVSQAVQWLTRLGTAAPDFALHLNISPVSMSDEQALDRLEHMVSASTIDPSRLIFEVKEAAAASRLESARQFTRRIHDLGAQLALDDFGAGFGSFYYLKHLHFDAVKISGDLLTKSVLNKTDRLILQSVLDLAKGLGKATIAKSVEDATMLEAAVAQGVDFAQGWHLSRPQPVEDLMGVILG